MTTYAAEYTEQIMHRGRIAMDPADFTPNWADKPRKQKFYPDAVRVPLPSGATDGAAPADRAFEGPGDREPLSDDLTQLAAMLQHSYGLIGRRLGIQANSDLGGLPRYGDAGWSRGTASGGGLYPISIYYVAGADAPLAAGIYHYSPMHHAFHQLLFGDVTGVVATACGRPTDGGSYFVLGLKYWQNAFKYNSFSFHAVTMDLGTTLATWSLWARSGGRDLTAQLWFDEPALADLLGIDNDDEAVYAVVPLAGRPGHATQEPSPATPVRGPRVSLADAEHSQLSYRFQAVERMQRETVVTGPQIPADLTGTPIAGHDTGGEGVQLPPPRALGASLTGALRARRSSFGRFVGAGLPAADLHALLRAAHSSGLRTDVVSDTGDLVTLYVFVNHVDGIACGAYRFEPDSGCLTLVVPGEQGRFLQDNYFLPNYNLEQAAAVIVPTVATHRVLDAVGPRGYRLVNAAVGAVSQGVYTASAALDVGCGVALGFDNISYIERLGLEPTGEKPLLIMAVGHEYGGVGNYRAELV